MHKMWADLARVRLNTNPIASEMLKVEEDPKKGDQHQIPQEKPSPKSESEVSKKSQTSGESKGSKSPEKSKNASKDTSTNDKPSRRFRDFLTGADIDSVESVFSSGVSSKSKEKSPGNKEEKQKSDDNSSRSQEFHFSQELMKFKFYRKLRSNKEQAIQIAGGIIGAIFIIAGIGHLFGAAFRVADNVVFGERAMISAFLILIGVLILAGVFARPLLQRTFLENIHNELEVAENQNSNEKVSDKKEKQKGNIEENDKR